MFDEVWARRSWQTSRWNVRASSPLAWLLCRRRRPSPCALGGVGCRSSKSQDRHLATAEACDKRMARWESEFTTVPTAFSSAMGRPHMSHRNRTPTQGCPWYSFLPHTPHHPNRPTRSPTWSNPPGRAVAGDLWSLRLQSRRGPGRDRASVPGGHERGEDMQRMEEEKDANAGHPPSESIGLGDIWNHWPSHIKTTMTLWDTTACGS